MVVVFLCIFMVLMVYGMIDPVYCSR